MIRLVFLSGALLLSLASHSQRPSPDSSLDSSIVSTDRFVAYTFANDASFRTDYYFTQGMNGTVVHPGLNRWPGNRLLALGRFRAVQHYGLRVYYDGYTPLRIQDPFIRVGDRPYASYIYAEYFRVATGMAAPWRLTTGLSVGVIGPAAGAKGFQTKLHALLDAPTPRGWDYQIRNDVVLGYTARLERQVSSWARAVEVIGGGTAALSTLRSYLGADARVRLGLFNPYFHDLGVASALNRTGLRRVQLYAEGWAEGRLVGYDATLQGGPLRRDNPYELPAAAIRRGVWRSTLTLGLGYKGVRLETSAVHVSPELRGGRRHRWAQVALRVAF